MKCCQRRQHADWRKDKPMPIAKRILSFLLSGAILMAVNLGGGQQVFAAANSEDQAYDIGVDAYLYLYPLVLMDVTRLQATNVPAGKVLMRGPMNTLINLPTFPPAEFRDVVRPNFDTLYSAAWLDLTKEPIILSVPDTDGRYYMMPMLDMWTDVFAVPGKRATGTQAGDFALVAPGWSGALPEGVTRIDSPTGMVWIIGRTQTNGPSDYKAVQKIQAGYKLTKLSDWGKTPSAEKTKLDPNVDMKTPPMLQVHKMPAGDFFAYGAELMKVNPPHMTDNDMIARMKRIGITAGESFDLGKAAPEVQQALERAAKDALELMQEKQATLNPLVNGWGVAVENMGVYGNSYLRRATVAMVGLGANPPEDAVYPLTFVDGEGEPLDGSNNYVLRFKKEELPPVDAFWSVTLYDKDGFPVPNDIKRQALGDRDEMKYGDDGSLEIYVQATSPGKDKESNWLPATKSGPFNLTLRLYGPRREVLTGKWVPPGVQKMK
jgi:hypothetical protein